VAQGPLGEPKVAAGILPTGIHTVSLALDTDPTSVSGLYLIPIFMSVGFGTQHRYFRVGSKLALFHTDLYRYSLRKTDWSSLQGDIVPGIAEGCRSKVPL
jgi:hypothetical protein